ncbi:MAG: inositol monophosphatase family protein, partial [Candidatus Rokuibacteriota bacterium]
RFPDHDILAEELGGGPSTRPAARWRWVFDPLDGTTNYAHGLPIFCASLALQIDGATDVGAVYDPSRHELFTAERGEGAYLNGEALAVSATSEAIDALLVTGFPYFYKQELVDLFATFLQRARAVRRLGSAALDLCYVAAGRFDGFWEQHLKPWDMAAGALVVTEAGGQITGMDGAPFDLTAGHVVASNGRVHEALVAVIRDFRARTASS